MSATFPMLLTASLALLVGACEPGPSSPSDTSAPSYETAAAAGTAQGTPRGDATGGALADTAGNTPPDSAEAGALENAAINAPTNPAEAGAPADETGGTPTGALAADTERVVEAACGECQFGLEGEGCDLAVRLDGQAFFVSGTGIDDHGDAHADDGFCNAIRAARVVGHPEGNRFVVSSFELLADEPRGPTSAGPSDG